MSFSAGSRKRTLIVAALALALLGGPAAASAAELPAADAVDATIVASPRDPVLRNDASELEIDVLVGNRGAQPLAETTLELALDPRPIASTDDLDGVFPQHPLDLAEGQLSAVAPDAEQTTTLTVPRNKLPFTSDTPSGVYLLRVSAAPDLSVTVPLVWQGATWPGKGGAGSAVRLGMIVPIVLPSDIHTLPTRSQLEELQSGWSRLLDEARTAQATLAIDPRVVAGIRAYGDEAPESARQFLARLEASTLPNFLLQFADADPSAQADLGFSALMQPSNLDFVTRFGSFSADTKQGAGGQLPGGAEPGAAVGGDGTAGDAANGESGAGGASDTAAADSSGTAGGSGDGGSADPSNPEGDTATAPSLAQLLQWDTVQPTAWPAEGSVDQATLDLLRASNINTVVLDSENVDRSSGGPRVALEQGTAVITDTMLAASARTALGASSEVERAAGVSRLAAQLLLAAQSGSGDLVLGLDRGAVADTEDPAALIEQLRALDWVASTPISGLDEGTALLRGADTLEERRELLRAAVGRESTVNELGAVLVNPEYLSGYQRTRLLDLFATRYAQPGTDFTKVAGQYRERDAELLQGVHAITTERMQLVGASTRVPVQLHNSLPFEAIVDVQAVPASAGLTVEEPRFADVVVPPEGNERVLVPVNSRVSSGESGLVVTIAATSGDLTVFTGTLPISIRSGVETVALSVLGALASLLLGFGIWRSVRRLRRRRTAGAGADAGASADADDAAVATHADSGTAGVSDSGVDSGNNTRLGNDTDPA